jgi:hypothetical protein
MQIEKKTREEKEGRRASRKERKKERNTCGSARP